MKTFDKSKGWFVRCVGGPLDGIHLRSWCLQGEAVAEAEALPRTMDIMSIHGEPSETAIDTRGQYVLRVTDKMATAKGTKVPAREWVWTPTD